MAPSASDRARSCLILCPFLPLLSATCSCCDYRLAAYSSSKSTSSLVLLSIRAAIRSRSLWPLGVMARPPLVCVLLDTTSMSSSCTDCSSCQAPSALQETSPRLTLPLCFHIMHVSQHKSCQMQQENHKHPCTTLMHKVLSLRCSNRDPIARAGRRGRSSAPTSACA